MNKWKGKRKQEDKSRLQCDIYCYPMIHRAEFGLAVRGKARYCVLRWRLFKLPASNINLVIGEQEIGIGWKQCAAGNLPAARHKVNSHPWMNPKGCLGCRNLSKPK